MPETGSFGDWFDEMLRNGSLDGITQTDAGGPVNNVVDDFQHGVETWARNVADPMDIDLAPQIQPLGASYAVAQDPGVETVDDQNSPETNQAMATHSQSENEDQICYGMVCRTARFYYEFVQSSNNKHIIVQHCTSN